MARRIPYCEVCKSSSNMRDRLQSVGLPGINHRLVDWCSCSTCKNSGNYYIKESYHESEIEAKNFKIQNLKSEMSQSEMIAKEELENLRESSTPKKILSM